MFIGQEQLLVAPYKHSEMLHNQLIWNIRLTDIDILGIWKKSLSNWGPGECSEESAWWLSPDVLKEGG